MTHVLSSAQMRAFEKLRERTLDGTQPWIGRVQALGGMSTSTTKAAVVVLEKFEIIRMTDAGPGRRRFELLTLDVRLGTPQEVCQARFVAKRYAHEGPIVDDGKFSEAFSKVCKSYGYLVMKPEPLFLRPAPKPDARVL